MPQVISGSSVGSLACCFVAMFKREDMAKNVTTEKIFEHGNFFEYKFKNFWELIEKYFSGQTIFEGKRLKEVIRGFLGDLTFKEVHEQRKWNVNIVVTDMQKIDESRLLNYLTAPNVVMWSAAVASCAIPGIYDPVELFEKDPETGEIVPYHRIHTLYVDGSVS